MIAAGLHGIDQGLELGPVCEGDAYRAPELTRLPTSLLQARDLFGGSALARESFGDEMVEHYVNAADVELAAFL